MNLTAAASQIESLPKRERVRLRRGRRSAGLWRILAEQDLEASSRDEKRYELVLRAIALVGQGDPDAKHTPDYGEALFTANYSQLRLERLLETKDLFDEARKTILFLEAQSDVLNQPPDWTQLNDYLKYQNEQARRAIARSYFYAKYNDSQ